MAETTSSPDIRVLVGVEGDVGIDTGSGKLISDTLNVIAKNISAKKTPQIAFSVDTKLTSGNITNQINEIIKAIKVEPINLGIRTTQSSISTFVEDEYRKLIDGTKGKKARANILAHIEEKHALSDIVVQKKKNEKATEEETKVAKEQLAVISRLVDAQRLLNTADNNASKLGNNELFAKIEIEKAKLGQLAQELDVFYEKIGGAENIKNHSDDEEFLNLAASIKECTNASIELQKISSKDTPLFAKDKRLADQARDVSDFSLSLEKYAKANDKFKSNSGLSAEFERIKAAISDLERRTNLGDDVRNDLTRLKKQTNEWKSSLQEAGLTGQTAFGKLRAQMEKLGVYMSASAILMGSWQQVKQMTQNVIELDHALVELQKVTDLTGKSLEKFTSQAFSVGKEIGRTGTEVIEATAEFARAGYSASQSLDLAKTALVMTNVADGINDATAASSSIIAVLAGFQMEADKATHVLDALNNVSNNFAVDTKNLTDILERTSGTIAQTGTSYEQLIGLATGGYKSLRNAEMVASGINMISQRLRGMAEDGSAIEGLIPKIEEDLQKYTNGSVSMLDKQTGGLRSTYDVLEDLSEVYPKLNDQQMAYINEAVAGNRQNKVLVAILQNWNDVKGAIESATNSTGSAEAENEKFLKGIQGKLNTLQSTYQELSSTILDSGLIGGTIDTGAGFLGALTWIIDSLGAIPTLATVAAGAMSTFSNKGGYAPLIKAA